MSKKNFKSQASSSRVASSPFVGAGFGASTAFGSGFGGSSASALSYVYEPPDLTRLASSAAVVAFKNLQKKDATTKAKALEDLLAVLEAPAGEQSQLEDAFIEAWIQLYPRTSIENDRRVRQNSHVLQGQVAEAAGKRIAKHMPAIVGAWLCGAQDNDKLVARAAQDAFNKLFSSPEKKSAVWRVYQSSILDYCRNCICVETPQTLSDERNTSPDFALAKHSRVVGSALMALTHALNNLDKNELSKLQETWSDILHEPSLLALSVNPDSAIRRSLYRLLTVALERLPEAIDFAAISRHLIQDGLDADQSGSAPDFVFALLLYTKANRDLWTVLYPGSGKKSAHRRLCRFLRRGVVGSNAAHWAQLANLLDIIPVEVLIDSETEQKDGSNVDSPILAAIREAATKRENLRPSNESAWNVYLRFAHKFLSLDTMSDKRAEICKDSILPLTGHFLEPEPSSKQWAVTGQQASLASKAAILSYKTNSEALLTFLENFSQRLIQDINISQPAQSKDYSQSQDSTILRARKWYALLADISSSADEEFNNILGHMLSQESHAALLLLKNRNGKPYGAASLLETMSQYLLKMIEITLDIREPLKAFLIEYAPKYMETASGLYLLRLIDKLQTSLQLESAYTECLKTLLKSEDGSRRDATLMSLLSKPWPEDTDLDRLIRDSMALTLQSALSGASSSWTAIQSCMRHEESPLDLLDSILEQTMSGLSISGRTSSSLEGVEALVNSRSNRLRSMLEKERGTELLSKLLSLTQSPPDDETMQRAIQLQRATENLLADGGSSTGANPRLELIQQSMFETGPYALNIDMLAANAVKLVHDASEEARDEIVEKLLSSTKQWNQMVLKHSSVALDDSIALTNPLGGAVFLVQRNEKLPAITMAATDYDASGLSALMRLIVFTSTFVRNDIVWKHLASQNSILEFLAVAAEIISDHQNIPSRMPLWHSFGSEEAGNEPTSIADARSSIGVMLAQAASTDSSIAKEMMLSIQKSINGTSLESYYNARAYVSFALDSAEVHGLKSSSVSEERFVKIRKSEDTIADVAFLITTAESTASLKAFNELMSDISGTNLVSDALTALRRLILLNTLSPTLANSAEHIPQQRLMFFTKHLVKFIGEENGLSQQVLAETLKALTFAAPLIKDLYGEFWESILSCLINTIKAPTSEPIVLHAALRLLNAFEALVKDDASEDLQETWNEQQRSRADALVSLLQLQAPVDDARHQPLRLVNGLLARLVSKGTKSSSVASDELFPAMASSSLSLQKAAYQMLYERVQEEQEGTSMEYAMGDRAAPRIPDEILSLLIQVPKSETLAALAEEADIPQAALTYLLSWKLIFAHWQNASYRVQSAYVDCLKEGNYVSDLLALVFDELITKRPANSPANVSKFAVPEYELGSADNPDADAQWLLANVYYLSLLHVPGLVKTWWRNSCPRALEKRVEEWTAKHFSPLVAAAELGAVAAWQPNPDDTTELEVKPNPRAREVVATYPVDEQHMAIRIVLPAEYPLQPVAITTVRRVATDERHWNSWLSTASIAANFASSSQGLGCVIDALAAWRKNVVAALKGHSECAICYSVVSAEGQLPAKRCGTCKNQFHGSCLFRWFKSSSSSSCPLCRNMFNYG